MAESPVLQIVTQHTEGDCAICCLAMYLGLSYEDVLVATSQLDTKSHRHGLYVNQIEKTAKALGTPLRRLRVFDLEQATGILCFYDHVVVLKAGLIFETNGTVWEPDVHRSFTKYEPTLLLQRRD